MVTDEIQELLDGGMEDGRMAELLHTLSVSPEKRKAFRDHLLIGREMKEDRYASALTFSEDAAVWESIAAAGALTATTASGAGRAVGVWAGRIAALAVVGVAGYILGTSTTNVGADGDAPVIVQRTTGDAGTSGTGTSGTGSAGRNTAQQTSPAAASSPMSSSASPATSSTDRMAAPPLALATTPRFPERSGNVGSRVSRTGSQNMTAQSAAARSTSAQAAVSQLSSTPENTGSIEFAREMFTALGGSSSVSDMSWIVPTTTESNMNGNGGAAKEGNGGTGTAPQQRTDSSNHPAEAALRAPMGIPIEGEESEAPVNSLLKNGFQAAFSERLGMLTSGAEQSSSSNQTFSYHAIDVSYHLNGGRFGFGGRLGYGSFSRVQLDSLPYQNMNGLAEDGVVSYVGSFTESRKVSVEAFVNYRHPVTDRIAVSLEAYVGGSSTHQQGGLEFSAIGFITDNFGVQLGAGAGNYWYDMSAEQERVKQTNANYAIDSDVKRAYRGVMLLGRYGLFYRF